MKSPFERAAELPALAACVRRAVADGAGRLAGPSGEGKVCAAFGVRGLLGAARALALGGLARARAASSCSLTGDAGAKPPAGSAAPGIVLAVVEDPEVALDFISDLRAFLAAAPLGARVSSPANGKTGGDPRLSPSSLMGESRVGVNSRGLVPPTPALPHEGGGSRAARAPGVERRPSPRSASWADPDLPPAASLPAELKTGLPLEVTLFPAWDVLPTESDRPDGLALAGRQRALARLRQARMHVASRPQASAVLRGRIPAEGGWATRSEGVAADPQVTDPLPEALLVVAPVAALMQPCEQPDDLGAELVLRRGGTWDPIALARRLDQMGYDRTGQVEEIGRAHV